MSEPDREDERVRFGREPAGLEETRYLEEQVPGADEYTFGDHTAGRKADFFLPSAEGQLGYPTDMLKDGEA